VVRDFKRAWQAADISALIGLLDPDATAVGDGGGLVTALPHPIEGAERIARFFADRTLPGRLALHECTVNGQPGLAAHLDGAVVSVYAFDIADGRIRRIWAVLNPEKLRPWRTE
ncbi:RNA polymerase subunit sigma-24, partial [Streptomyces roseolus]